jgi:hypothetical protein
MGIQLSDTTKQSGHVQRVERWTRRPYGTSGDELREIINDLNEAERELAYLMLTRGKYLGWDDNRHTTKPTGTFNIVANQNDYKITEDENNFDIYDIAFVRVIRQTGDTHSIDLERIEANDPRVPEFLNPDTSVTGEPSQFLQLGNRIFFDVLPESSITAGGRIGFKRMNKEFTVTGTSGDDTTESSLPPTAQPLIHYKAALVWNEVNRSDDAALIGSLREKIAVGERRLGISIDLAHPTRNKMTMKKILYK